MSEVYIFKNCERFIDESNYDSREFDQSLETMIALADRLKSTSNPQEDKPIFFKADQLWQKIQLDLFESKAEVDSGLPSKKYMRLIETVEKILVLKNKHEITPATQKEIDNIFKLSPMKTAELLEKIKTEDISIDFNQKNEAGESLASHWVKWGDLEIIDKIIDIPSVIVQIKEQNTSILSKLNLAFLYFSDEQARLTSLIRVIEKARLPLSAEDKWIIKAFKNDLDFSEEEFRALDDRVKLKLCFVANSCLHEGFIRKLKVFDFKTETLFSPHNVDFALNMDLIEVKNSLNDFFNELFQKGALLNASEFEKLDENSYVEKRGSQIDRIQGKHFLESIIKRNHFNFVKVPEKILVRGDADESITVSMRQKNTNIELISYNVTLWAEKIESVDRQISLEEAYEWLALLEESCYGDFIGRNFIVSHDGIYLIDTSMENFVREPAFKAIESLILPYLKKDDQAEFLTLLQKRQMDYEEKGRKENAEKLSQYYDHFYNTMELPYNNLMRQFLSTSHEGYQFSVPVEGIQNSNPKTIQIQQMVLH